LIVSHITELINVIINEQYSLLYKDEVYDDAIRTGDRMRGYIKQFALIIKLMFRCKFKKYRPNADKILMSERILRLNDNSHPEDIKTVLKMSKKNL
jgi:predicted RNA-binding protein (virulence factor B family)